MTRVVLPGLAATVVTSSVVGFSMLGGTDTTGSDPAASGSGQRLGTDNSAHAANRAGMSLASGAGKAAEVADELADRRQVISRSARRVTIEDKPEVQDHEFATVALNVRKAPAEDAATIETVDPGTKLAVTGVTKGEWSEVVWEGDTRWVAGDYLADDKAEVDTVTVGGFSSAPCAYGSSIEGGITSSAVRVLRAVCAEFPQITSYGGWRGDGEHSDGRAIDIMVSGALGWQVADYLRANSSALGLYDIIYSQRIWTAQRSAEGWRSMSDRGSTTANHYDHVHVKVF